jgi:hypothetical protein
MKIQKDARYQGRAAASRTVGRRFGQLVARTTELVMLLPAIPLMRSAADGLGGGSRQERTP